MTMLLSLKSLNVPNFAPDLQSWMRYFSSSQNTSPKQLSFFFEVLQVFFWFKLQSRNFSANFIFLVTSHTDNTRVFKITLDFLLPRDRNSSWRGMKCFLWQVQLWIQISIPRECATITYFFVSERMFDLRLWFWVLQVRIWADWL